MASQKELFATGTLQGSLGQMFQMHRPPGYLSIRSCFPRQVFTSSDKDTRGLGSQLYIALARYAGVFKKIPVWRIPDSSLFLVSDKMLRHP